MPPGMSEAARNVSAEDKKKIDALFQKAFSVSIVEEEEATWTALIDNYGSIPEIMARAVSNRGNARARQGKLQEAL
eukprot:5489567-Heterocapsa_arctica.AAC.1